MTANPIWIAAYGGPPPAVVGASAVWIAPGDGTVLSAVASYIAGYFNPVAGASPVWIAGYGGPPPAAIGATPITIVGYGGFGGAAPTNSPEALAYLARTVGGNEGGNGANIATLIDGLVSDGVWAKLDALYVLAQQNQPDALLNLVGTSYPLVSQGLLKSVPFVSYVGFGPFSGSEALVNGLVPPSTNFVQNSASFGVWVYNTGLGVSGGAQIGNDTGVGGSHIYDYFTDGNFYARVNNGTVGGVPSPATKGLYVGDRPSSTTVIPYYNGTGQASQASPSQVPAANQFIIGGISIPASQQFSAAHIGASLGAVGQLALYNRLRTYMTAVGVP